MSKTHLNSDLFASSLPEREHANGLRAGVLWVLAGCLFGLVALVFPAVGSAASDPVAPGTEGIAAAVVGEAPAVVVEAPGTGSVSIVAEAGATAEGAEGGAPSGEAEVEGEGEEVEGTDPTDGDGGAGAPGADPAEPVEEADEIAPEGAPGTGQNEASGATADDPDDAEGVHGEGEILDSTDEESDDAGATAEPSATPESDDRAPAGHAGVASGNHHPIAVAGPPAVPTVPGGSPVRAASPEATRPGRDAAEHRSAHLPRAAASPRFRLRQKRAYTGRPEGWSPLSLMTSSKPGANPSRSPAGATPPGAGKRSPIPGTPPPQSPGGAPSASGSGGGGHGGSPFAAALPATLVAGPPKSFRRLEEGGAGDPSPASSPVLERPG